MDTGMKFKSGDIVRCIDDGGHAALSTDATYEVERFEGGRVYLKHAIYGGWAATRFELVETVQPVLTGGSSDYYKLPLCATEIMDLIEHKNMGFALGNIFKAVYRLGDKPGTSRKYDLEKIIYFAQRELDRL